MAGDWKELVSRYQGAVGRASEMVRTRHVSTSASNIEWEDLEQRLGEVHRQYVTGRIPQAHVSNEDKLQFQVLLENLELSKSRLDDPEKFERDAVERALASLKHHALILMDTGPHGPITGRPNFDGAGPHCPITGRPDTGHQTPTGGDEPDGKDKI